MLFLFGFSVFVSTGVVSGYWVGQQVELARMRRRIAYNRRVLKRIENDAARAKLLEMQADEQRAFLSDSFKVKPRPIEFMKDGLD